MALYFKFKSAKDYSSIPIDGNYITVGELKDRIFETKIGRGKDFDLVITNAQNNEDYVDESTWIPANTSVLIRRLPGWPRKPIVIGPVPVEDKPKSKEEHEFTQDTVKNGGLIVDSQEWDDFFSSGNSTSTSTLTTIDDEESKIQALVDTPALEWQKDSGFNSCGGRGMGRKRMGRHIPPEGYICHRCKEAGHFIQHCPTNGDPDYDVKKVRPPRGIPKSMLVAAPDGLYTLPDGKVAVLKPDEAAFEKEVEGLPGTQRPVRDIPPELYCKMCKKVMAFAVITSKCCFDSFCDQCIRNYIISKSTCVCGATDILADDLLPNLTLRNTINRILEFNNSSVTNDSGLQVQDIKINYSQAKVAQDMKTHNSQAKVASPMQSVASNNGEAVVASKKEDAVAHEESEAAKKKRKKAHMPIDDGVMQWSAAQNLATENNVMPMAFAAYNSYWTPGIQPGMEGFMTLGPALSYMNFGVGRPDISFGDVLPREQCSGPPIMRKIAEIDARKAVPKRKFDTVRHGSLRDQEHDRDVRRVHFSERPSTDCRKQDFNNYKRQRSHHDEHYHYTEDAHYQHSRHIHSFQTSH